jgi:uncharacterized protein (DUF1330 family)
VLVNLTIDDPVGYHAEYGRHMPELLKGFGGEVLVADDQPDLLEGGGPVGFVVVFRFPHPGDLRYPTVTIAMWSLQPSPAAPTSS